MTSSIPRYPLVSTIAGSGRPGFIDGLTNEAYFDHPADLCSLGGASGFVIIADGRNNCIRRLDLSNGFVTTIPTHSFLGPRSPILIDGGAAVAICDSNHNKIRLVQLSAPSPSSAPGLSSSGRVSSIPASNVMSSSLSASPSPTLSVEQDCTIAGTGRAGHHDGLAEFATFSRPSGLALAPDGSIFVADAGNNLIRRIAARPGKAGLYVTTVAGGGASGSTKEGCADGDGALALFSNPSSLIVDSFGVIIIADTGNACLRALHAPPAHPGAPAGSPPRYDAPACEWAVTTLAGGGGGGYEDGPSPSAAAFREPARLALGAGGELLVTDATTRSVRALVPSAVLDASGGAHAPSCGAAWMGGTTEEPAIENDPPLATAAGTVGGHPPPAPDFCYIPVGHVAAVARRALALDGGQAGRGGGGSNSKSRSSNSGSNSSSISSGSASGIARVSVFVPPSLLSPPNNDQAEPLGSRLLRRFAGVHEGGARGSIPVPPWFSTMVAGGGPAFAAFSALAAELIEREAEAEEAAAATASEAAVSEAREALSAAVSSSNLPALPMSPAESANASRASSPFSVGGTSQNFQSMPSVTLQYGEGQSAAATTAAAAAARSKAISARARKLAQLLPHTVVFFEDPSAILATHTRYGLTITVAGPTPTMVKLALERGGAGGKGGAAAAASIAAASSFSSLSRGMTMGTLVRAEGGGGGGGTTVFHPFSDGASLLEARFKRPYGLCALPRGEGFLVADMGNHCIRFLMSAAAAEAEAGGAAAGGVARAASLVSAEILSSAETAQRALEAVQEVEYGHWPFARLAAGTGGEGPFPLPLFAEAGEGEARSPLASSSSVASALPASPSRAFSSTEAVGGGNAPTTVDGTPREAPVGVGGDSNASAASAASRLPSPSPNQRGNAQQETGTRPERFRSSYVVAPPRLTTPLLPERDAQVAEARTDGIKRVGGGAIVLTAGSPASAAHHQSRATSPSWKPARRIPATCTMGFTSPRLIVPLPGGGKVVTGLHPSSFPPPSSSAAGRARASATISTRLPPHIEPAPHLQSALKAQRSQIALRMAEEEEWQKLLRVQEHPLYTGNVEKAPEAVVAATAAVGVGVEGQQQESESKHASDSASALSSSSIAGSVSQGTSRGSETAPPTRAGSSAATTALPPHSSASKLSVMQLASVKWHDSSRVGVGGGAQAYEDDSLAATNGGMGRRQQQVPPTLAGIVIPPAHLPPYRRATSALREAEAARLQANGDDGSAAPWDGLSQSIGLSKTAPQQQQQEQQGAGGAASRTFRQTGKAMTGGTELGSSSRHPPVPVWEAISALHPAFSASGAPLPSRSGASTFTSASTLSSSFGSSAAANSATGDGADAAKYLPHGMSAALPPNWHIYEQSLGHGRHHAPDLTDSRTSISREEASAAGDVVRALLLTDAIQQQHQQQQQGGASEVFEGGESGDIYPPPPHPPAFDMSRVTTAEPALINARFARHTVSSSHALKASGRPTVRDAPAFVNVASVISRKMEALSRAAAAAAPQPLVGEGSGGSSWRDALSAWEESGREAVIEAEYTEEEEQLTFPPPPAPAVHPRRIEKEPWRMPTERLSASAGGEGGSVIKRRAAALKASFDRTSLGSYTVNRSSQSGGASTWRSLSPRSSASIPLESRGPLWRRRSAHKIVADLDREIAEAVVASEEAAAAEAAVRYAEQLAWERGRDSYAREGGGGGGASTRRGGSSVGSESSRSSGSHVRFYLPSATFADEQRQRQEAEAEAEAEAAGRGRGTSPIRRLPLFQEEVFVEEEDQQDAYAAAYEETPEGGAAQLTDLERLAM